MMACLSMLLPPPARIKMALVTLLGVCPLTASLPALGGSLLPTWHPSLLNVLVTGAFVAALTRMIMPTLTRLFARWLFFKKGAFQ